MATCKSYVTVELDFTPHYPHGGAAPFLIIVWPTRSLKESRHGTPPEASPFEIHRARQMYPRRPRQKTFGEQLPLREANALAEGRVAVIYHHNTRRKGGHDLEVSHWLAQLGEDALAIRANAYSCRTFFLF